VKWLRFPRVLGIVVCLYLVGLAVLFASLGRQAAQFNHNAASTTGTVVALVPRAPAGSTREPVNARHPTLAPTVHYEVGGRGYDYTAAHGRYRQPVRVGDTLTVLYDPADPSVARLRGEGRVLVPGLAGGFLVAAAAVALVLVKTRHLGGPRRRRPPANPEQVVARAAGAS
jgi:hypothetical protein